MLCAMAITVERARCSEPELALVGEQAIAAFLRQLWLERARARRTVAVRSVGRWLRQGLPAARLAGGPWVAGRAEVATWWAEYFAEDIARALERHRRVDARRGLRHTTERFTSQVRTPGCERAR